MTTTDRTRPRRYRRIAALAALVAAAGLFLALPQLLSWSGGRRILSARAGRILAPGSLEAAAVQVSWFGPTVIDQAVLRDERGTRLIVAPRAVVDWSLWQILFNQPAAATLTMPGAEIEIERRPDGRIDLYQTLEPIIREEPEIRLVVEISGGRLRFRDPRWSSLSWPIPRISGSTSPRIPNLSMEPRAPAQLRGRQRLRGGLRSRAASTGRGPAARRSRWRWRGGRWPWRSQAPW